MYRTPSLPIVCLMLGHLGCNPAPPAADAGEDPSIGTDARGLREADSGLPAEDGGRSEDSGSVDTGISPDAFIAPPIPPGRYVRRLTALQLARSLRYATGQVWQNFGARAATLGQPDYLRTHTDRTDITAAFLRVAEEGARETCSAAITAERGLTNPAMRPVLGAVNLSSPDTSSRRQNLRRLILRFHGFDVRTDDDPRVTAFLPILEDPLGGSLPATELEAARWRTVCVALATHLDFLTY